MGGGRLLEVPLASMGISCRGAVIVRTSPRVDKGQNKKPEPHWSPGPLSCPLSFRECQLAEAQLFFCPV
jgi:hypothetical protein